MILQYSTRSICRSSVSLLRNTARTTYTKTSASKQRLVSDSTVTAATVAIRANTNPQIPSRSSSLWAIYCRALDRSPLLTKATLAACIFFGSDSATQYILHYKNQGEDALFRWDAVRALSGASFGVIATTWLHYWWGFLEAFVGARLCINRYRLANTITKVILDQGIGAPLYIYSYYVLTNFAERVSDNPHNAIQAWKDVNTKASDMLWPTMMQHWKVWPAVHSINFYFTPLHHRVLVQNTVLVGWSGYLSHLNHHEQEILDNKGHLMTPDEEIKVTIVRKETIQKMQQQEDLKKKATAATAAALV